MNIGLYIYIYIYILQKDGRKPAQLGLQMVSHVTSRKLSVGSPLRTLLCGAFVSYNLNLHSDFLSGYQTLFFPRPSSQVSLEDGTVKGFDVRQASDSASDLKPCFTIHAHDKPVNSVSYNNSAPNVISLSLSSLIYMISFEKLGMEQSKH